MNAIMSVESHATAPQSADTPNSKRLLPLFVLTLAAILAADPASAGSKHHSKAEPKEGGLFVPPTPLDHPPLVLTNFGVDKHEVQVELPPAAAAPASKAEVAPLAMAGDEPPAPTGVAALKIRSLFQ